MDKRQVQPMIKEKEEEKNKKKKLENQGEEVKSDKDSPYNVKICDIWGTTSKDQTSFGVKRWIEGSNVYLYNEKMGFKEPIPEDTDDYKQYKLEDIDKELFRLDNKLKNKQYENKQDLLTNIKRLKNWKRSIELQGRGAYMRLGYDGKPYFEFDRIGNFRMPVFKNVDKSLLYTPSESKIKLGSELIIENTQKNGDPNKSIKLISIVLIVCLILTIGIFAYATYKTNELPDVCSANLDKASAVYVNSANKIDRIAGNLENLSSKMYLRPDDVKQEIVPEVVN